LWCSCVDTTRRKLIMKDDRNAIPDWPQPADESGSN